MMIFTAKLTRKKTALFVILAGLFVGLVILLAGALGGEDSPVSPTGVSLEGIHDNAERVAFLESYGWQVSQEPVETLRLLLPAELEGSWVTYNDLQKQQGLDLAPYCGKQVERFTYAVANYPGISEGVQVNLYLCGDTVAAGDIFCTGENGFQSTLEFPSENAGDS